MALIDGLRRQLRSVIQWENPSPDTLFLRWTDNGDEIKNASKLIVGPGQGCIFVYEGRVEAVIEQECMVDLKTQNIPFWTTVTKLMQLFVSEHKVGIYYKSMATKGRFPLKGYTLPLTPKGRSSVIDSPPWHYGGDILAIWFSMDKKLARAFIPPPLEMGPRPGEGMVWFPEWVSVSDAQPDLACVDPERAVYRECFVMLNCQFKGVPGYFVPFIWVDNDFTLM